MITTPINATLPATGAGAALVSLPAGETCKGWAVQARGAVDMKIGTSAAEITAGTYWTVKSGQSHYLDDILGPGASLFYAESGSTASTVEVLRKRRD